MLFSDALLKLNFSPVEANVFITLCKHHPLTGYEVAKLSGASRSNVYAALHTLQEKGFCYVSLGDSKKYCPISKAEFLKLVDKEFELIQHTITMNYPEIAIDQMPYITLLGYDNILQKTRNAITSCESHIYILSEIEYIRLFLTELDCISQTKKVTILCNHTIELPNAYTYIRMKAPTGFHMIIDTSLIITGEFNQSSGQCLYTKNPSLVRLMRESFVTELDMIQLYK